MKSDEVISKTNLDLISELTMRGNDQRFHAITKFSDSDSFTEEMRRDGVSVLRNIFKKGEVEKAKAALDEIYKRQCKDVLNNDFSLEDIMDENVVRMPFVENNIFLTYILNRRIVNKLKFLLGEQFILMLQNAPINRPTNAHQGFSWHRDLVWQHYTSNRPLAITVTVALDDYTTTNGGMDVLLGSHLFSEFPSKSYSSNKSAKILVKAGDVIFFDSMLYHRAGINTSTESRYLLVQVYCLPHIRQQICIPSMISQTELNLAREDLAILGVGYETPKSVIEWRKKRVTRIKL